MERCQHRPRAGLVESTGVQSDSRPSKRAPGSRRALGSVPVVHNRLDPPQGTGRSPSMNRSQQAERQTQRDQASSNGDSGGSEPEPPEQSYQIRMRTVRSRRYTPVPNRQTATDYANSARGCSPQNAPSAVANPNVIRAPRGRVPSISSDSESEGDRGSSVHTRPSRRPPPSLAEDFSDCGPTLHAREPLSSHFQPAEASHPVVLEV